MAGELASFGIQKLWDLLSHEYEQFQGVEDQVEELKTDLNTLKSFLKDAAAQKHTNEVVRSCVERINEIVLDAEDTIETIVIKDELRKHGSIRRLARIVPARRKIASEIGSLSKKIEKVVRDMKNFGVRQIFVDGRDSQPSQQKSEFAKIHESNLVGMEHNVKTLLGYLVEEDDDKVVSITGMGGLGKTTLARQAFHDNLVKKKFDRLAWVCVSQVCDHMKVWQAILQNFRSKEGQIEIQKMTEATLQGELFGLLETSNSLIVLDDIWKKEDWDMIKPIFPLKAGSKVLLTSRNERVAGLGETYIKNFKPEYLSEQDSWTLFKSIAMPTKDASELTPDDEEMEKMGKKMTEHCGGLPLAVRVLGGMLAEKYTIHNWKRLSENIRSHLVGRTNDNNKTLLNHILSLSFEELPGYLKFCFLYLAHFPEDYEIDVEDLSYYWAAEGIITYETGDSIRDVGDNYIEELVRRNMVISERDKTTGRFETCHLHDLMREICLSKAKEEKFLHTVGISSPTAHSKFPSTSRRFVSHDPKALDVGRDINNSKVRSLVVIWKSNFYLSLFLEKMFLWGLPEDKFIDPFYRDQLFWRVSELGFTRMQFLRVLHLPGARFKGMWLSNSIGKLIHLRYLNLDAAWVSHFPSSLQNLKLLIYLNLNVIGCSYLPSHTYLLEMKELRFLALPRGMQKKTKLELNHLVNLETLVNFSTKYCDLKDLRGMTRLRTLGINITDETSLETLSASIDGLRHLENLDILSERDRGTREWSTLFEFNNLKQLKLMTRYPLVSDELQFPSRLTSLYLSNSNLRLDPMPILEKLVHLKEVRLGDGSFSGRRMVCLRGGFPQLKELWFSRLAKLEEWIVEEGSMPILHTLFISNCNKLKELPDGLRFITSLKDLRVENMGEEWEKILSKGGEDYKVQHIPSVRFI